jgi:hypothetical protein
MGDNIFKLTNKCFLLFSVKNVATRRRLSSATLSPSSRRRPFVDSPATTTSQSDLSRFEQEREPTTTKKLLVSIVSYIFDPNLTKSESYPTFDQI